MGEYQNISTALHKAVEISQIYITLDLEFSEGSVEQNPGGKYQLVLAFAFAVGVNP